MNPRHDVPYKCVATACGKVFPDGHPGAFSCDRYPACILVADVPEPIAEPRTRSERQDAQVPPSVPAKLEAYPPGTEPSRLILGGAYRLLEELPSGNQARVYRGERVQDGLKVFIKTIHNPANRPDYFAKLYMLQDKILSLDHPNLLRCYSFEPEEGMWIEVSEFAEGRKLSEVLSQWKKEGRRATDDEVRAALTQLSEAIHYLHSNFNLVHRDIKPDNITVIQKSDGLCFKIVDYGTVSALQGGGVTLLAGTPLYAPPEFFSGFSHIANEEQLDKWDWFSLGRIIQEMVDGIHPYDRLKADDPVGGRDELGDRSVVEMTKFARIMSERYYSAYHCWAGMVELSEESPGRTYWIPLLKGLLTSSLNRRWGRDEVVSFLSGKTPHAYYGARFEDEEFEYQGKRQDLRTWARELSTAERWADARDVLYKTDVRYYIGTIRKIVDLANEIDRDVELLDRDLATGLFLTRLSGGEIRPQVGGFSLNRDYVRAVAEADPDPESVISDRPKHLHTLMSRTFAERLTSLPVAGSRQDLDGIASLWKEVGAFRTALDSLGVEYSVKEFDVDPSIPLRYILSSRADLESRIREARGTLSHTENNALQSVYCQEDPSAISTPAVQALWFALQHSDKNGFRTYHYQAEQLKGQANFIKYGLVWRQIRDFLEPTYLPWFGNPKWVFWTWAIAVFILGGYGLQKGLAANPSKPASVSLFLILLPIVAVVAGGIALLWREFLWHGLESWARQGLEGLPPDDLRPSRDINSETARIRAASYLRQVAPELEHASPAELQNALEARNREMERLRGMVSPSEFKIEARRWTGSRTLIAQAVLILVLLPLSVYVYGRVVTPPKPVPTDYPGVSFTAPTDSWSDKYYLPKIGGRTIWNSNRERFTIRSSNGKQYTHEVAVDYTFPGPHEWLQFQSLTDRPIEILLFSYAPPADGKPIHYRVTAPSNNWSKKVLLGNQFEVLWSQDLALPFQVQDNTGRTVDSKDYVPVIGNTGEKPIWVMFKSNSNYAIDIRLEVKPGSTVTRQQTSKVPPSPALDTFSPPIPASARPAHAGPLLSEWNDGGPDCLKLFQSATPNAYAVKVWYCEAGEPSESITVVSTDGQFVNREARFYLRFLDDQSLSASYEYPPPNRGVFRKDVRFKRSVKHDSPTLPDRSDDPEVLRVGNGVTAPVVIDKVEPTYSEEARHESISGTVRLYVEVDTNGRARNTRVVRGLGFGLDERAVEAVNKWRFRPGSRDGKPVIVAANIEVTFRLLGNAVRVAPSPVDPIARLLVDAEQKITRRDYDGAFADAESAVRAAPNDARAAALLERVRRIRAILK